MPSVLVVDDDADILNSLTDLLVDEGMDILIASDGAAALAVLRQETPSLIILDVMMPRMDGITFRLCQLADPRLASIPVLLMSAAHNSSDVALGLKVWGHIRKPLDVPLLLQMIASACAA